jgi:hypothetical protein
MTTNAVAAVPNIANVNKTQRFIGNINTKIAVVHIALGSILAEDKMPFLHT